MQQHLMETGVIANRFEAFTKEDYTGPLDDIATMLCTPDTVGNWLSHTALIESGKPGTVVGILEDDALICSDFLVRIEYIKKFLASHVWDIFFLGGTFHADRGQWHPEIGKDHELTPTKHIVRLYGAWSNQGYLVNGNSSTKIVSMMKSVMSTSTGSDHALIQIQPHLQCFGFVPGSVFQVDGVSDIGKGITKFSNFLKMGQYVWTNTLKEFDYDCWLAMHKGL